MPLRNSYPSPPTWTRSTTTRGARAVTTSRVTHPRLSGRVGGKFEDNMVLEYFEKPLKNQWIGSGCAESRRGGAGSTRPAFRSPKNHSFLPNHLLSAVISTYFEMFLWNSQWILELKFSFEQYFFCQIWAETMITRATVQFFLIRRYYSPHHKAFSVYQWFCVEWGFALRKLFKLDLCSLFWWNLTSSTSFRAAMLIFSQICWVHTS